MLVYLKYSACVVGEYSMDLLLPLLVFVCVEFTIIFSEELSECNTTAYYNYANFFFSDNHNCNTVRN